MLKLPSRSSMDQERICWWRITVFLFVFLLGGMVSWFGYLWLIQIPGGQGRFSLIGEYQTLRGIMLYFSMVLGMLSRGLHDHIQKYNGVNLYELLLKVIRSTSFLTAVIVSPIVFFTIYNMARLVPDDVVSMLFAFQNGFFWKTVLEKSEIK